jgi:hypothetical protein
MVSTRMPPTKARSAHLFSAGTTYQGAQRVDVALSASSYADWYSTQCPRSARSAAENFQ